MKTVRELKQAVALGLKRVKSFPGIIEGLVYASSNRRSVGRIVYTTHLPSNGLEEPKSDEDFGVCVELWFRRGGKKLVGFGHEPNDLSTDAVRRAIHKAQRDAVPDPDFYGFLKPDATDRSKRAVSHEYDKTLLSFSSTQEAKALSTLSWETISGAVDVLQSYSKRKKLEPQKLAFILNGDNFLISERMALATTNGISDHEESTVVLSFLTAMLEREKAKGSAWGATIRLDGLSAYDIGRRAALAAIAGIGGKRIRSGRYRVIFGPQAVTELFGSLLLPHLTLGMADFGATIFGGQYGKQIASPLLTMYDDATLPGGAGNKRITCEGCPTGKTLLIDQGKLVGFLSDSRTTNKVFQNAKESTKKLGVDPHQIRQAISPRNGFRFSRGGGRVAASTVGIHATNLVIDTPQPFSEGKLLKTVKDGVYIGRLWYTYPVGGYSTGIISGTAIADSCRIRNGKLAEPILPNTVRLEDDLSQMIKNIIGVGNNQLPTILWASDEITHAPWVAINDVRLLSINR